MVPHLREFLDPARGGGVFRGNHVWIWYRRPALWTTVIWGRPDVTDCEAIVRVWDFARDPSMDPSFMSLVDCQRLVAVDPAAFDIVASYLRTHAATFDAIISRQALVRPDGIVGSIVSGFFASVDSPVAPRLVKEAVDGYRWLLGHDEGGRIAAEFDARFRASDSIGTLLASLRVHLARDPGGATLETAARAVGVSTRSLQRQLASSGTTFRVELTSVRIRHARERLIQTDKKIEAIAAEVGYASAQQFSRAFRAATGVSPDELRATKRA